ncbi:MAG: NifU family protein [Roseiarcus sp.]
MLDAVSAGAFEDLVAAPSAPRRRLVGFDNRPRGEAPAKPAAPPKTARRIEGAEMEATIVAAIEAMRPRLQLDGGDCQFVGVVDDVIRVKLSGACIGCQLSSMTMIGVRMKLTEALGFLVKVAPV